ncbi:MAG: HAMP domain-containing sensor histidine kinase [Dokdonella sp.]
MSRLYLKFYFALLGSLAVFAFAAVVVWHGTGLADEGENSMLGRVVQNTLPPVDAPAAQQQAALRALAAGLDVDALLLAPDHTRLAAIGHDLDQGWAIDLPDGRRLLSSRPLSGHPHYMLLLVLLVLVLTVGVAAYPLVRRIATRLERLQTGVEALGAGDLSARVAVEGHDEVAHLAASFNRAATRIDELVSAHKSLLANASHELRTPLTRIRLTVELMKESADPQRKHALNQDIAELDQLIDEILLASRLDAITEPDVEEEVDLLALAAEECSRYNEAELDGAPITLRGDSRLLRRLLRNLLENARRHGVPPTRVYLGRNAHGVEIVVRDEGPCVSAAQCDRMFAPFYRRTGAGESIGAGLGLSLVRQIARRHGGEARCEPTDEGHIRFVVTLSDAR